MLCIVRSIVLRMVMVAVVGEYRIAGKWWWRALEAGIAILNHSHISILYFALYIDRLVPI